MRDRVPRILVPLGLYWLVGLGLPLLDGAWARPEFRVHALNTMLVSAAIAFVWLGPQLVQRIGARVVAAGEDALRLASLAQGEAGVRARPVRTRRRP